MNKSLTAIVRRVMENSPFRNGAVINDSDVLEFQQEIEVLMAVSPSGESERTI